MTDVSLDSLGPIDYLVVEFPAGSTNFTGEMAEELSGSSTRGTIRVIDILILVKGEDGIVDAMELSDLDDLGELQALEAELAELLAEDDVEKLAAAMEPGSPQASSSGRTCGPRPSVRQHDGRADNSSPTDASRSKPSSPRSRLMPSTKKEHDMPVGLGRVGRVGVIGHPVAKTAVVAKAVTPGPSPVAKTAVVAAAVTPGRGVRRRI